MKAFYGYFGEDFMTGQKEFSGIMRICLRKIWHYTGKIRCLYEIFGGLQKQTGPELKEESFTVHTTAEPVLL